MKRFKTSRAFLYHAHGFAISGMITKPFQDFIPTQAGATLPTTGGLAETTVNDYAYKDIVSFKRAYTRITGMPANGGNVHETDMKVIIEGLNIRDRFTADKVVTHIRCKHTLGEFGKENKDRSEIMPVESDIVGVKIDGQPVNITLDKQFFHEFSNYARLREAYKKGFFRKRVQEKFHWVPEKSKAKVPDCVQTRYKWAERLKKKLPEHGHILCTLVDKVEGDNLDGRVFGNIIVLPDFGTIYLGDYFIDRHSTRLEMVRVELEGPVKGTVVDGGNGGGNGFPPSGT
jgi:hypothetical protein